MKLFVVTMEDTVVQTRDYTVLAKDKDEAVSLISNGMYLVESEATTVDNDDVSRVKAIVEIKSNGEDVVL